MKEPVRIARKGSMNGLTTGHGRYRLNVYSTHRLLKARRSRKKTRKNERTSNRWKILCLPVALEKGNMDNRIWQMFRACSLYFLVLNILLHCALFSTNASNVPPKSQSWGSVLIISFTFSEFYRGCFRVYHYICVTGQSIVIRKQIKTYGIAKDKQAKSCISWERQDREMVGRTSRQEWSDRFPMVFQQDATLPWYACKDCKFT